MSRSPGRSNRRSSRAAAKHLERAGGEAPRQLVRRPRDERAGAHVVAVRAVGAEGEPGPHGQRKPVEELLGEAPLLERGNEFLGESVLCQQGLSRDHRPQSYRLTGSTATRRIDQTAVFLVVQFTRRKRCRSSRPRTPFPPVIVLRSSRRASSSRLAPPKGAVRCAWGPGLTSGPLRVS